MQKRNFRRWAAVTAAVVSLTGCAGTNLGALGDILGGMGGAGAGGQQQVLAEVQAVDTNRQLIQLRTQDGQTGNVQFDQNTVVTYQQQQYPVTALERGDVAYFQLQQNGQSVYVSRVDVQQSVQERTGQTGTGGSAGYQQLSGTVGQVDYNAGRFELRTQNGTAVVSLPYNASNTTVSTFQRLRTGQSVRIEGQNLGNGRVELSRFL
jgi:hypothetical protein